MENTNRNSVLPPVPVTWECWEKHLCANTVAHVFIFPCLGPTLEKVCESVLVGFFVFFSCPQTQCRQVAGHGKKGLMKK